MSWANIITIIISAILTDNIVLSKTLGICPLLGTSKKTDSAVGMGLAVTFVITVSGLVCYGLFQLLLAWDIVYLQTIVHTRYSFARAVARYSAKAFQSHFI